MKIAICMASFRQVWVRTMMSIFKTYTHLSNKGFQVTFHVVEGKSFDKAFNEVAVKALKTSPDFLVFTADDHEFKPEQVEYLINVAKEHDMSSPLITAKHPPYFPIVYDYKLKPVLDYPIGLINAVGVITVVSSKVFSKINYPYFKIDQRTGQGEDTYFFKKVLKAGVKPVTDTRVHFNHLGGTITPSFWEVLKGKGIVEKIREVKDE